MVFFISVRGEGKCEINYRKKEKKNFLKDVFPCGFPISGDKKGEKSKWFFYFHKGREKM